MWAIEAQLAPVGKSPHGLGLEHARIATRWPSGYRSPSITVERRADVSDSSDHRRIIVGSSADQNFLISRSAANRASASEAKSFGVTTLSTVSPPTLPIRALGKMAARQCPGLRRYVTIENSEMSAIGIRPRMTGSRQLSSDVNASRGIAGSGTARPCLESMQSAYRLPPITVTPVHQIASACGLVPHLVTASA